SLDDLEAGARQQIAEDLHVDLLILDRQDELAHDGIACRSTVMGSVNANVEPCPTLDCTEILPPCSSIIFFDIARPSPVPLLVLVIELSACWNCWKSLAWSAALIPGPVSR